MDIELGSNKRVHLSEKEAELVSIMANKYCLGVRELILLSVLSLIQEPELSITTCKDTWNKSCCNE